MRSYYIWQLLMVLVACQVRLTWTLYLDGENRLQDLLVFINDDVTQPDGTILDRIKAHISEASLALWTATGAMSKGVAGVQLGTVYIRVPKSWTYDGQLTTWQQCNKAHFFLSTSRDNNYRMEPFMKQLQSCGSPGEFVRFPINFFDDKSDLKVKVAGKKMMTEFVKLRYGVFSEKPYDKGLTVFDGLTFINSTCGADVKWILSGSPADCAKDACTYTINSNQNHKYSVMFDDESPSSEYFCNDGDMPHNSLAQSLQNLKCNGRSVSSVILGHADFKIKKPAVNFKNADFIVIKDGVKKIALVLDISGSMAMVIDNMKRACVEFIRNNVNTSDMVGLVVFNSYAMKISNLSIMSDVNKKSLVNNIVQLNANGATNIPDGLAKGIEILGGNIETNEGTFGTIILLSDGENNVESPYKYEYAINQTVMKGLMVNTISYGSQADPQLNRLAKESGGMFIHTNQISTYTDLRWKFARKLPCDKSPQTQPVISGSINITVGGNVPPTNITYIDQYIGTNVEVSLTFNTDMSQYEVLLVSPAGIQYNVSRTIIQPAGTTVTFAIPGSSETGMYKLITRRRLVGRRKRSVQQMNVKYIISSTTDTNSLRVILPTGSLSSSEIKMLTDTSKIVANVDLTTSGITPPEYVTLILIVTMPFGSTKTITMVDDGLGDDMIENDKIFTCTLNAKDMYEIGFYNFVANIDIINNKTKVIIRRFVDLGSVRVHAVQSMPLTDKVPPAKINDVIFGIENMQKRIIWIEILAPGNDGMIGNISKYEILLVHSNKVILLNYTVQAQAKQKIRLSVDLSSDNVSNPFTVSIRGVDDNGNAGDWSLPKYLSWHYDDIVKFYTTKIFPGNAAPPMTYSGLSLRIIVSASIALINRLINLC